MMVPTLEHELAPQRSQPCPAVAAVVPQACRAGVPAARCGGLWRKGATATASCTSAVAPWPAPWSGSAYKRASGWRYWRRISRNARGPLWRTRCRGGAGMHQHPPEARSIAFILRHCAARVLICDREFGAVAQQALAMLDAPPLLVGIDDDQAERADLAHDLDYEAFLAQGDPGRPLSAPQNEWQSIAINYTSGTTGIPGRGPASPRRLPQRLRRRADLPVGAAQRLPVDLADVPLQRLEPYLGGDVVRWHPCVPAQGPA